MGRRFDEDRSIAFVTVKLEQPSPDFVQSRIALTRYRLAGEDGVGPRGERDAINVNRASDPALVLI
jgi:hypothetical protein